MHTALPASDMHAYGTPEFLGQDSWNNHLRSCVFLSIIITPTTEDQSEGIYGKLDSNDKIRQMVTGFGIFDRQLTKT